MQGKRAYRVALVQAVQQAVRCGDHDLTALAQLGSLLLDGLPAHNGHGLEAAGGSRRQRHCCRSVHSTAVRKAHRRHMKIYRMDTSHGRVRRTGETPVLPWCTCTAWCAGCTAVQVQVHQGSTHSSCAAAHMQHRWYRRYTLTWCTAPASWSPPQSVVPARAWAPAPPRTARQRC